MYNRVEVFSATKSRDRHELGKKVTGWLRDHQDFEVVNTVVRQSSDAEFHCLTIVLFGKENSTK